MRSNILLHKLPRRDLATHIHCQQHPPLPQPAAAIPRSHTGQVVNVRPSRPEHLHKSGCQMPSTRLPHLEGMGVEKAPADESYKALQLSALTYAAPAWQPWAAPSRIEQLARCQNKALRVVTGQLKFTQLKHSDGRPASVASQRRLSAQRRWPTRKYTDCHQTTREDKS